MTSLKGLEALIDWFMPGEFSEDAHSRKRVRMFLISHIFGPILGAPIPIFLFLYDPHPFPHVPILAAQIAAFWLFPIALKLFPAHYTALALLSTINLSSAILWGSYNYGGVSSPFLMWFLVMPLLAFFYLGSTARTRVIIFAQIVLGLSAFYAAYVLDGAFPVHIPLEDMVGAGIVSAFSAATYVFLMASYYSSVVDSQSELLKEIERHQATMKLAEQARDDAERANGAKSEFLAKMSHELRTPLNAVLGYSEILLEDAEIEGRGEQIADLQKISAAGKHLLAMVNDILDISKIEAGKMELHVETVDLDRLVDEVEATSRPLAAKNTNNFVVERSGDLGTIRVDVTKLRQAMFNLISNAAKFTQNGQIKLKVVREPRMTGDWLAISVADTGVGISEEQQKTLFSNFTQANAKIAAKYGGTGLGLSLSQNLIALMGGKIALESEPGKGACFTICLPADISALVLEEDVDLVEQAESEHEQRKVLNAGLSGHAPDHARRQKVLLVDDDRDFLELAERLLIKEGYSPIATDSPESALQIARSVQPSLIFCDVMMPGLDGWDVLQTLQSDPATLEIPVIMLSVLDERSLGRDSGAAGFLTKPLDQDKLRKALESAKAFRRFVTASDATPSGAAV
ncbi:ATP-binding response regulator [Nitratireductor basaltis]|uniref:histidine kinase n=1 Tax=Nitratireductor basaltis TaxID=472175 RepID=A0A084U652_9HYPH|nr:ATP-binding protein [Nitratireductor basaltis]KFB08438.1 Histidine kinase [Nitratireductor basaltis]